MDDYKPNSHRFKEEQKANQVERKKVEKVINGTAKTQKNELRKFADVFISEDIKNVKSYVLMDVLVPAIKKAISDIVTNGIDIILYGESGRNKKSSIASKISYRSYFDQREDERYDHREKKQTRFDYEDIILDSYGEAEEVIFRMTELIETYGDVSVGDLYDLVGITDDNYMNNKYGWKNLHNAKPVRARGGGYKLGLPRVLPID